MLGSSVVDLSKVELTLRIGPDHWLFASSKNDVLPLSFAAPALPCISQSPGPSMHLHSGAGLIRKHPNISSISSFKDRFESLRPNRSLIGGRTPSILQYTALRNAGNISKGPVSISPFRRRLHQWEHYPDRIRTT
jgi:hypothetical protein